MKLSREQALRYFESRLGQLRKSGATWMASCPWHGPDRNPSMSLDFDKNVFHCHACKEGGNIVQMEAKLNGLSKEQAMRAVAEFAGIPQEALPFDSNRTHEATYVYRDEHGVPLYEIRRFRFADGKKKFTFAKQDGKGWIYSSKGQKIVPYRLNELIVARQVFIVEGEKAADCLAEKLTEAGLAGVSVTSNPFGAGNWRPEFAPFFAGRDVAILPDNDEVGAKHAEAVAGNVAQYARAVKVVPLPDLEPKGDVVDFFAAGKTLEDVRKAVGQAPNWRPSEQRSGLLIPAHQFCSTIHDEIEWLVEGVIQLGANGIIAADPKGGKSWCAADLALAISTGGNWLGFACRQMPVALVSREDNPALTGWRLKHLAAARGIDIPCNLFVNSRSQSPQFMLTNTDQLAEMKAAIKQLDPGLIILDVFNVLHDADENDQTDIRKVLDAAAQLASGPQCSVCIVHHFRKSGAGDTSMTQQLRGSSAIAGWVEWLMGISLAEAGQKTRRAEFELKAAMSPEPVFFTIESNEQSAWLQVQQKAMAASWRN